MDVTPTEPVGAVVGDVALDALPDADLDRLRDLLAAHGVLAFRDQELDDDGFVTFLRRLGALTFTQGETPVEGHPDLNVVTNVGREHPPRSRFHVDTSYVADPPAYTALRVVQVPARGGATVFSNQFRALATLDDELRALVEGRSATHVVTGLDLPDDAETSATHPLVRPHPRTGVPALYLSTADRVRHVEGLEDAAARELVEALLAHSTTDDNVHQHAWAPGDVVVWDNACVLHRADHSAVDGDRTLHRGMVGADGHHG